jgi:Pyruvate/2-oxoacid:ferredoxin oxidoreductase delta subunit
MVLRNIVKIDQEKCNGCGLCIPSCAEGAIQIINGKAQLVKDVYCDGLGACLGKCPQDAITIEQREAEEFDKQAAHEHVQTTKKTVSVPPVSCPSAQPMQFNLQEPTETSPQRQKTELTMWPVQLKLLPPYAPFLKEADLLIAADCVPFAYPNFHQDFLKNKVLTVGCPKLDDVSLYRNKLAEIFRTANIKTITIVNMEVPCCFGLKRLVEEAMELAGKHIPLRQTTISIKGEILPNQNV